MLKLDFYFLFFFLSPSQSMNRQVYETVISALQGKAKKGRNSFLSVRPRFSHFDHFCTKQLKDPSAALHPPAPPSIFIYLFSFIGSNKNVAVL